MNLIGVEDKKKQKQIYTEYMTKQNETLEEIAIKFCVSVQDLRIINRLAQSDAFFQPRKLKIPLQ